MNNKLQILTNGLIPVYSNENQEKLVNARELHEFLEVGKDFTTWIRDRIKQYEFVENQDFIILTNFGENPKGGRPKKEFIFKLYPAKEIAMIENNKKGREVRRYFIDIEKKYKNQINTLFDIAIKNIDKRLNVMEKILNNTVKIMDNINKDISVIKYIQSSRNLKMDKRTLQIRKQIENIMAEYSEINDAPIQEVRNFVYRKMLNYGLDVYKAKEKLETSSFIDAVIQMGWIQEMLDITDGLLVENRTRI
jgi:anti-repressor protein